MRLALRLAVAGLALLGAACAGGDDDGDSQDTTTTTAAPTTTTTAPPVAPLTGLVVDDPARLDRPAAMVKVDNADAVIGRQEGLDEADVVVVEMVEGGATRLAAVVHSRDTVIGPVRSARTSDLAIATSFGQPLLAFSGANSGVLGQVRASDAVVDAGYDNPAATDVYRRNQRGSGLYRFFLPTAELHETVTGEGRPEPLVAYRGPGQPSIGDPVTGVDLGYGGGVATTVAYDWNGAGWARSQKGRPHVLAGGTQLAPPNVVVLLVPYQASGFSDSTGVASPEAVLDGEGEALFLSDGKVVHGRWHRGGPGGRLGFVDAAGLPVVLTPGQTFVELVPAGNPPALR